MTTLLFSIRPDAALDAELARLSALPPLLPFSAPLREFVTDFSRRVFALPQLRQHPELATLGHWFRSAAVNQLSQRIGTRPTELDLARGLIFHLAPANVDVLFAYAWLMSVLSGNTNVARLSQKQSTQRDALVSILHDMQREGLHPEVLERAVLLTYPTTMQSPRRSPAAATHASSGVATPRLQRSAHCRSPRLPLNWPSPTALAWQ